MDSFYFSLHVFEHFRIYCKYHHQRNRFATAEEELEHFLDKMGKPDWVWAEQYERKDESEIDMDEEDSLMLFVENGTESKLFNILVLLRKLV